MPIDERWRSVSDEAWEQLALGWLAEIRLHAGDVDEDDTESEDDDYRDMVVRMNFTADSGLQQLFIEFAMKHASSEDELGAIAAGPVEHLMAWHGAEHIEWLEHMAKSQQKYAKMTKGVWQHRMSDAFYGRIQALQKLAD